VTASAILAIVKLVLSLCDQVMGKMHDDDLKDAGAHAAALPNLQRALDAKRKADAVDAAFDSGRLRPEDDPFLHRNTGR